MQESKTTFEWMWDTKTVLLSTQKMDAINEHLNVETLIHFDKSQISKLPQALLWTASHLEKHLAKPEVFKNWGQRGGSKDKWPLFICHELLVRYKFTSVVAVDIWLNGNLNEINRTEILCGQHVIFECPDALRAVSRLLQKDLTKMKARMKAEPKADDQWRRLPARQK